MSTRSSLIIVLAATVLPASIGRAAAEDRVAVAEKAAEANATTPEGKKYEDAVGTAFGRDHGKSIQACAKELKRPDLSDFKVLVRVSAAGEVSEALVKPSTNLAACVQGKLVAWKVGAPPQADQWVGVQVTLKRK